MKASTHKIADMHPTLAAPYKTLWVAQRASLLEQRAVLRGGEFGRAEASAEHFGHKEDSSAQINTERELEFAQEAALAGKAAAATPSPTRASRLDCSDVDDDERGAVGR